LLSSFAYACGTDLHPRLQNEIQGISDLCSPQTGLFVSSGQASNIVTLNASGEATVEFRVGMQPGNNYRLPATVFPTNSLASLQTTSDSANGFVPADTDKVKGGFNGALSPLLTVWRKLHLEIDSMTAVPTSGPQANSLSAKVLILKTNYPNLGQTAVYFRASSYPMQTNRYENGTLTIPGIANYQVIVGQGADYQWQFNNYLNYVVVSGTIPSSAIGSPAQLRDDDERWVALADLPRLPMDGHSQSQQFIEGFTPSKSSKPVPGIAPAYAPAFISVIDANTVGWNTRRTVPFHLNKDLVDSPLFWAYTATLGFQPDYSEDGDPDREDYILGLSGESPITASSFGFSAVYVKTISDYAIEYVAGHSSDGVQNQRAYFLWLIGNVAHGLGHAPGKGFENLTDHAEKGLMQKGGDKITSAFKAVSIRRFRTSSSWTGGVP
jgi:hypothetical protein